VRRIANYLSFMLSAALASLRIKRPDVVVATSPQFFCGWAGAIVSWLKWRPFVLEIRDIWPESIQAVEAVGNRHLLWILEKMERWMYRAATHIVAVGDGYRDNILSKVDAGDQISVISNGVDVEQYRPLAPDRELRKSWGVNGRFVCSYVGTIGMAHGLDVVPDAAKILKDKGRQDIGFVLVGDGARRVELQRRARELGLDEIVTFAGRCAKEDMPAVLASSDACLIHLRKTALFATVIPSKIFETMAMGRPIIMGVDGEARGIVAEAQAGIDMEPGSAESLVAAVERLADDPGLAEDLGRYARDYVREHYNRDVLAAEMLEVLEQVGGEKINAEGAAGREDDKRKGRGGKRRR